MLNLAKNILQQSYNDLIKKNNNTAVLILEDGKKIFGTGFGYPGIKAGELCFNTSMSGYQEIITDPSYNGQIITFTFPHIGNVGTNLEDYESTKSCAEAQNAPILGRPKSDQREPVDAKGGQNLVLIDDFQRN